MPTLPCPHCSQPLEVAVSRAGSEVPCPACGQSVAVPKLGELRQLENATAADSPADSDATAGTSVARRIAFVALLAVAALAAIVGSYCLIRYATITVPETTEGHIGQIEEMYPQLPAGQLVREWQDLEKFTPALAHPYQYQQIAADKSKWLRQSLTALGISVVAILAAVALIALRTRQPHRSPA